MQEDSHQEGLSKEDINRRLRELDELKNTFVALVSHELRTPINLISGYLELGLDILERDASTAQDYFEQVEENVERLTRVVEELTDFARLQRGKPLNQSDPLPIGVTFRQTYSLLRPDIEEKNIDLRVYLPKNIREMNYDAESMLILFRNILSNAAKFSPPGSRLYIKGEETEEDLIIAFYDHASPIPEEKRESIFEDFRQIENYLTRRYEGMGLGLAVARRTARMLGGDILLNVRKDGNTFKIKLPKNNH